MWKSAAAAQISHWISSSGRVLFEEASTQRKQKSVAKILANGVMHFWRSINTSRGSGGMSKPLQIEQSNNLEEKKLGEVKLGKQEVSKMNMPINSFIVFHNALGLHVIMFIFRSLLVEFNC